MKNAKVITFISNKGGVGKTVMAVNFAISLSQKSRKSTALLDTNPSLGEDVSSIMDIPEAYSLMQYMMESAKKQDINYKSSTKHGVNVFTVQDNGAIPGNLDTGSALKKLRKEYDYIIVDTGQMISGSLLQILENTDLALLLTTPDTLSINHCGLAIARLKELHFPSTAIQVVLNRANGKTGIVTSDIEEYTKKDIFVSIPEDQDTIQKSINTETPFTVKNSNSPLAKAVEKLADQVLSGRDRKGEHIFSESNDDSAKQAANESKPQHDKPEAAKDAARIDEIVIKVHRILVKEMNLKKTVVTDALHKEVAEKIGEILDREKIKTATRLERISLVKRIMDEVLGLGPLEGLLADDDVSEIIVNAPDKIYVEAGGLISKSNKSFIDNNHILRVIERIITPLGKRIDESSPYVDARLPDGSRVNAIINPLSLEGPTMTIRKFKKDVLTIESLIEYGTLNERMAEFLKLCVSSRKNIIISGGTGTGKTTLLNTVSGFIPSSERIITIEDSAELKLPQEHVIRLEAKPPNIEGKGAVTIRDLVRNALRMRPDRIVIGECRGGEALDMLQAMNTGHDGSITTVHSNSSRDALSRIETMVLMSGMELPIKAIREQIASAIQLIIQVSRFLSDGSRKITQISEVTGIENDIITLQDIFRFSQDGHGINGRVSGGFKNTGFVPGFLGDLQSRGYEIDMGMFQ